MNKIEGNSIMLNTLIKKLHTHRKVPLFEIRPVVVTMPSDTCSSSPTALLQDDVHQTTMLKRLFYEFWDHKRVWLEHQCWNRDYQLHFKHTNYLNGCTSCSLSENKKWLNKFWKPCPKSNSDYILKPFPKISLNCILEPV